MSVWRRGRWDKYLTQRSRQGSWSLNLCRNPLTRAIWMFYRKHQTNNAWCFCYFICLAFHSYYMAFFPFHSILPCSPNKSLWSESWDLWDTGNLWFAAAHLCASSPIQSTKQHGAFLFCFHVTGRAISDLQVNLLTRMPVLCYQLQSKRMSGFFSTYRIYVLT